MRKENLDKAIDKVVAIKMKAVDQLITDLVEPLSDVGNPEKVLGKPYENWTPQDLAMAIKIYGQGENTPLTKLIFNKTYERVLRLEEENA